MWPTVLSKLPVKFSVYGIYFDKTHYHSHYLYGTCFKLNLLQPYANLAPVHFFRHVGMIFLPPNCGSSISRSEVKDSIAPVDRHAVLRKCEALNRRFSPSHKFHLTFHGLTFVRPVATEER